MTTTLNYNYDNVTEIDIAMAAVHTTHIARKSCHVSYAVLKSFILMSCIQIITNLYDHH